MWVGLPLFVFGLFQYAATRVPILVTVFSKMQHTGGIVLGWLFLPIVIVTLIVTVLLCIDIVRGWKEKDDTEQLIEKNKALVNELEEAKRMPIWGLVIVVGC